MGVRSKKVLIGSTVFLLSLFLYSNNVSAASISLTVSEDTMSVNVASIKSNGTFNKSSTSTIAAGTDNLTGYTLSIAASNSTYPSRLINGSDNNTSTNHLDSITEPVTEASFSALNSTSYNNKWGYLPSKYHSATNTDFLPAPPTTGDILNVTECANGTTNCPSSSDQYTITLGARVDSSTKIGSYSNHFAILVVANAIPYTINYNDSVVTNMPTDVDTTSMADTVAIANNIPERDGYTFLGWCTTMPTSSNNKDLDTCSGTEYAAGANYSLDGATTNNLSLYAMWSKDMTFNDVFEEAGKTKYNGYYAIQDTTSTICSNVDQGQVGQLIDRRDNEVYYVGKLPDNRCWMLDNLRLGNTYDINLTSSNTNIANNYTLPAGVTTGVNTTLEPRIVVAYKDNIPTHYGPGSGKTGTYYNFCAASAGTICISSNNSNATYDICPFGWRLPTGGDGGEFQTLTQNVSGRSETFPDTNSLFRTTFSVTLAGNYSNNSISSVDISSGYYSSTRSSTTNMYYLSTYQQQQHNIYPINSNGSRGGGRSIRCILKQ